MPKVEQVLEVAVQVVEQELGPLLELVREIFNVLEPLRLN